MRELHANLRHEFTLLRDQVDYLTDRHSERKDEALNESESLNALVNSVNLKAM